MTDQDPLLVLRDQAGLVVAHVFSVFPDLPEFIDGVFLAFLTCAPSLGFCHMSLHLYFPLCGLSKRVKTNVHKTSILRLGALGTVQSQHLHLLPLQLMKSRSLYMDILIIG